MWSFAGVLLLVTLADLRICPSVKVRNSVANLDKLEGCTVVEGHVHIVLIEMSNETEWESWTFPQLREVTEYMLFFRIKGLRSLGQLFPNLVRIGGTSLFIDYGLIVHEMLSLQELGLHSLQQVARGSVIITKNSNLCYVDTIDWDLIAKWDPMKNFVRRNRKDCPACPAHCAQGLCWSHSHSQCQIKEEWSHCHRLCMGGCSAPGSQHCHACRGVLTPDNECVETCPTGMYEYLSRRCVTREHCLSMPPVGAPGMLVFNGTCTDSCPPGFEVSGGAPTCQPCPGGRCHKWCPSMNIEDVGDAQKLKGCTHINGSLEISIRSGKPRIVFQELEDNLGSIEEIQSYLKVVRSFPIVNLNFLKNLTTIRGKYNGDPGFENNYSLLVLENQNLQELWDWDVKKNFSITSGKVFFHYNPKLCPQHIHKLLSIVHQDNVTNIEVGSDSNGDKFPCNSTNIDISVIFKTSDHIQIHVPYLAIDYDATILRYVVHFTKDPHKNISMFDDFDQCLDYGWRTKDISVDPHDSDFVKNGFNVNLTDLDPYTQYAFYVTTYTVNRFGAKSALYYETTFPSKPSEITQLRAYSNKSSEITLQWDPPKNINGKLQEYVVMWSILDFNEAQIRLRNYCEQPMVYISESEPIIQPIVHPHIHENDNNCCKKQVQIHKDGFEKLCSNYDHCPFSNYIYDKDLSMSCESCFYSYVYQYPFGTVSHYTTISTVNKTDISVSGLNQYNLRRSKLKPTRLSSVSVPGNSTGFTIKNLQHFKEFLITVRACREIHPEELDKSTESLCSNKDVTVVRTRKTEFADVISGGIYYSEVSNGTVYLLWNSPLKPNGLIVAFEIEHRRSDMATTNPITDCISYSDFMLNNERFTIVGLTPGRYEARARAISLAGRGPYTDHIYFKIESNYISVFEIVFSAFILCVIIISTVFGLTIYQKKKHILDLTLVASVNPDYLYVADNWEISRENLELGRELGSGSFGKVYEGILKLEDTRCAVKTMNEDLTLYDRFVFLSEASVMKTMSGAYHIVKLLGVVSLGTPPLVVMEFMDSGDLKTYLRSTREIQPALPATMVRMAIQIADGMAFMEAKKFVHRDLAARNCMVSENCIVKVGDFGMTRDIYETDYYRKNNTGLLPIRWMAPESLKDGVFTSKSDTWSYGVVLWEISTLAEQPYQGSSNDQVLQAVIAGRRLEVPPCCPDLLQHIMTACWRRKPAHRMTFMQILTSLGEHHNEDFKQVSYYHSQEATEERRRSGNDYAEMRSVEDPLLADSRSRPTVSGILSKVRLLRLSRIEESPSGEEI